MTDAESLLPDARRRMMFWGAAFFLGTFGAGFGGLIFAPGATVSVALFMAAMLFLIPFTRASNRYQIVSGRGSPAMRRYNQRFMIASFVYVLTIVGAVWLAKVDGIPRPAYVLIALAPAVPILGMIGVMAKLLIEEQDEYLRSRQIHNALIATGFTLAVTTVWGFLEQFGLVVHLPSYLVFPVWALGLGIGQCWSWARS